MPVFQIELHFMRADVAIFAELEEKQCWLTEIYFSHFFLKSLSFSQCQLIVLWQLIWNCYLRTSITTVKLLPHNSYNFWTFAFLKACTLLSPLGIKSCACLRAPRLTQRTLTYPQLGRFTAHTERSSNQFSFTPTEINTHTSTHRAFEHQPQNRDAYKQPTNIILDKKL